MSATRCLIFTADTAVQEWLRAVLLGMDAHVIVAPSADRARQALRREGPFDLALATVSWPDMSALAWAREARAEGFGMPIFVLAAYADAPLRAAAHAIGEVILVDKYVTEDELVRHVERVRAKVSVAEASSKIAIVVREKRRLPPSQIPRHPA